MKKEDTTELEAFIHRHFDQFKKAMIFCSSVCSNADKYALIPSYLFKGFSSAYTKTITQLEKANFKHLYPHEEKVKLLEKRIANYFVGPSPQPPVESITEEEEILFQQFKEDLLNANLSEQIISNFKKLILGITWNQS